MRAVAWALLLLGLFAATTACDRRQEAAAPPPVSQPSARASAETSEQADEFLIKLAALRHLLADQPRAADRAAYSAYLIRDPDAAKLAAALSAGPAADGPPIVASVDAYRRKGRTIDAATGKPVKVFEVRVVRAPGPDGAAEVVASWQAGRFAGASYRYRLRKQADAWVFSDRVDVNP